VENHNNQINYFNHHLTLLNFSWMQHSLLLGYLKAV